MAQRSDMTEKKRVLFDGEEVQGLVAFGEIPLEKGTIDVPGFSRIRTIQNGIVTIPAVEMTFKIQRDSDTLRFFREWFEGDEVKDVTVIRVDASGSEFARTLLQGAELTRYREPEFDAANPTFAQVNVTMTPEDIIPIDGE